MAKTARLVHIPTLYTMMIQFSVQAPVVQRLDNAIHGINVDKTNHAIHWIVIYPVDSVIHFLNNRGQDAYMYLPLVPQVRGAYL